MRLHEVSFAYSPEAPVLREINLAIAPGERLILLGANGAGKSTLLSLLNGLLTPTAGSVHGDQRLVATVLQDPDDQLFADTPLRDVALGPLEQGFDDVAAADAARAALAQMGVAHLAARPIFSLSLGEKKRVALAGALVVRPEVLLLDEPTAGLDWPGTEALLETLHLLSAEGTAIVAATHDTDALLAWATRGLVLAGGRIRCDLPARTLWADWSRHTAGCGLRTPALREGSRC
jgi:cobalt/nickel transport system ATP-binding protein